MEEQKMKFDSMDIGTLEKMADDARTRSRVQQKEFIEILFYLRISKRWKENKRYAKSSFWAYIEDLFNMREKTYRESERAFVKFTSETVEHGVGLVAKIDRLCKSTDVKKVFQEIDKAKEGKAVVSRDKIDKIINKHRDPEKAIPERKDYKALYIREVEAHQRTKETLKAALKEIEEMAGQIEKLKATAKIVTSMRNVLRQPEAQPAA
jgi:soluble cytochrome b562